MNNQIEDQRYLELSADCLKQKRFARAIYYLKKFQQTNPHHTAYCDDLIADLNKIKGLNLLTQGLWGNKL